MAGNKYDTVIWDWNGTLVNDIQLCADLANDLLKRQHLPPMTVEEYKNVFGFPITDYYKRVGIDFEKESFGEISKKFIAAYHDRIKSCDLHKNAKTVLETFKTRKIVQYILTAAHKKSVLPQLDYYSVSSYFKAVEGLDNYRAESKVHRGLELVKNYNIDKKSTILIGDTLHDYEVSKAIGVDCILVAYGHQSRKRLEMGTNSKIPIVGAIYQLLDLI